MPVGNPPYVDMADILWRWRQNDAAVTRYRQARDLENGAGRSFLTLRLGECLAKMGKTEEARRELESIKNDTYAGKEAQKLLLELHELKGGD